MTGGSGSTVPFAGDLTSPAFDFSNAIDKALSGALQAAVTAPFRLAYLPVDLIVGMTSGPPTLKPIPFTAGEATVGVEGERVLEALALVLEQRPSLRIKVCGRATQLDREARLADEGFSVSEPCLPASLNASKANSVRSLMTVPSPSARADPRARHQGQAGAGNRASDAGDNGPPRVEIEL